MGNQVPKTNTPVSDAQMAQAIIRVWERLFGTDPSQEQVYMVMAQNAIETGPDRASMHNYNVGNIIVGNTDHDYFLGGDWMFSDKSETQKKKITQKFRAYNSLEEGLTDYLKLLSSSKRYAPAWEHIKHPDIRAYSKALHDAGYYGAKEEEYTKGLIGQLRRFNKGNSYSAALSGQEHSPSMLAGQDTMTTQKLNDILQQFVGKLQLAATDHNLKKLYKSALSNNDILIQINAPDHTSAVEFSRVLCTALDEDLLSSSYPHTDGNLVEVECSIAGPQKECFEAVQQMTQAVADTFKDATSKVGGITIKNNVIMNKKSSYQPISPRTAGTNYRKFLLKFV
jgi:mannosyl-glycoprotein endo-beta-N-acetylglucosaminidase